MHILLFFILIALIFPGLMRFILSMIGLAILCTIIVASAHACEDGDSLPPPHYTQAQLHQRAAEVARFGSCVVADPKPPLNARSLPNSKGDISRHLDNGTEVTIKETFGNWVYVSGECDDQIGWVFRPLIMCGN